MATVVKVHHHTDWTLKKQVVFVHLLVFCPRSQVLIAKETKRKILLSMVRRHSLEQLQPLSTDETLDGNTDREMVRCISWKYHHLTHRSYLDLSNVEQRQCIALRSIEYTYRLFHNWWESIFNSININIVIGIIFFDCWCWEDFDFIGTLFHFNGCYRFIIIIGTATTGNWALFRICGCRW